MDALPHSRCILARSHKYPYSQLDLFIVDRKGEKSQDDVAAWVLPPLESVLATFKARGITLPPGNYRVSAYGDSAEMSRELLALIYADKKRGSACLRWTYDFEKELPPVVGDIEIVLDHQNEPVLVTKIVRVDEHPFREVGADFAAVEAEGDGSLAYWRHEHWRYFSRECARIGRRFHFLVRAHVKL